jgi:hypothetical protein
MMWKQLSFTGRRFLLPLVVTAAAVLSSFGATASAAEVHTYAESVGEGELAMTWQSEIEINQETGEVYVADTEHSRIAKFTASGTADGALATPFKPTAIAIDNSSGPSKGDIYALANDSKTITKLDSVGLPVTSWGISGQLTESEEIIGIAVDPNGNLWVMTQDLVLRPDEAPEKDTIILRGFDQAGNPLEDAGWVHEYVGFFHFFQSDMSFDTGGNLYVLRWHYGPKIDPLDRLQRSLEAIGPTGTQIAASIGEGGKSALGNAVDLSDGRLYVARIEPGGGVHKEDAELEAYPLEGPNKLTKRIERFGGGREGPERFLNAVTGSGVDGLLEPASVAVYEADHAVYVADPASQKIIVYRLENVEPPTVTLGPAEDVTQTSAHFVGHISPGTPPPTGAHVRDVFWEFECTPKCPGHTGYIEADGLEHTVEATIEGLEAGTEYSIRLAGENHGGIARSEERTFATAPAPPSVLSQPASDVVRGEATLNAGVNPNGAPTTYHFEYLTRTAFEAEGFGGAQTQRTPESEALPAPAEIHEVSARIAGLQPATEYVFRAVAVNSIGTTDGAPVSFLTQLGPNPIETDCTNQALRTGPGARLPDCRAYELVSPVDKQGGAVEPYEAWLQATDDGSAVTWYTGESATGVPSPGGAAHQDPAFYLSSSGTGGWSTQRLLPPEAGGERGHFAGLSDDGRYAVLEATVSRAGDEPALYLLDTANQAFTAIAPPQAGQRMEHRAFQFDGASANDLLFFFESSLHLTANAAPGKGNLYVWNRETGELTLAGILPGVKNEAPAEGSFGGAYAWWASDEVNPTVGGAEHGLYVGALHAISSSGDSVYFTARKTGQLYLRRGLTGSKPTTTRVSVANSGVTDHNGEQPAAFQEATPNGEKVFFLSSGKLTQDANTGSSDEGSDLYRYDAAAKKLVDVAPLAAGAGARVQGLLGAAEDGKSGYLAAKGVLAAGGVEGKNNLYHFEEQAGGGFSYTFVAALSSAGSEEDNWSPLATRPKNGRVSSDGGTLLFISSLPLNGEPKGSCIYGTCGEVYRYSLAEGSLSCLSCNPSAKGLPQIGAELSTSGAPNLVPENWPLYGTLPRNLSSSGTRVFFESSEALLPEDVNSHGCTTQEHCVDVYEWEAKETGSCKVPNVGNGCLYLLSSGESGQSSHFASASADGDSAFIVTNSPLVPLDGDELGDMYDVRVDGGLPSQHATPPQPCGSAEACKGPSSTPKPTTSPGSQTFQGPGNTKPARCRKGFVRKHGKCVKKKHHGKKRHHKRHSGGAK